MTKVIIMMIMLSIDVMTVSQLFAHSVAVYHLKHIAIIRLYFCIDSK